MHYHTRKLFISGSAAVMALLALVSAPAQADKSRPAPAKARPNVAAKAPAARPLLSDSVRELTARFLKQQEANRAINRARRVAQGKPALPDPNDKRSMRARARDGAEPGSRLGVYDQALLHYLKPRAFPYDRFDLSLLNRAAAQRDALPPAPLRAGVKAQPASPSAPRALLGPAALATAPWENIGPAGYGNGSTSWRIGGITYDPVSVNTYYIAAPKGGVWKSTNRGASWTPIIDSQFGLATSCVAVDYTNNKNIYVGTGDYDGGNGPGFGVLKSTDGGATWRVVGAAQFGAAPIRKITINPVTPSTIFATGGGNGLFRSLDRGETWTMVLGPTATPTAPAVNGSASNVVYNSYRDTIYCSFDNAGVYQSVDAGRTWVVTPGAPTGAGRFDVATSQIFSLRGKKTLYVLAGGPGSAAIGPEGAGAVWKAEPPVDDDRGAVQWKQLQNFPKARRGERSVWAQKGYNFVLAVGRTKINIAASPPTANPFVPRRTNVPQDLVIVGLIGMHLSRDGGKLWQPSPIGHVDQHAIAVSPRYNPSSTETEFLIGNDGGAFRVTYITDLRDPASVNTPPGRGRIRTNPPDPADVAGTREDPTYPDDPFEIPDAVPDDDPPTSIRPLQFKPFWGFYGFNSVNATLAIGQFYTADFSSHVTSDSRPDRAVGGTQDNGNQAPLFGMPDGSVNPDAWFNVNGGDGGACGISHENENVQFSSDYNYQIVDPELPPTYDVYRTDSAWQFGAEYIELFTGDDVRPFILAGGMNKADANYFYAATNFLYRLDNAATVWEKYLTRFTTEDNYVNAVGSSKLDARILYVGTTDGLLYYTNEADNLGAEFRDVRGNLPLRAITDITPSPLDPKKVYVTLSGFGVGHVWRCNNITAANPVWSNISGALPDVPTNAIEVLPGAGEREIFVGTDIGVFYSNNGGVTWFNASRPLGLPNVDVREITYVPATKMLNIASFGRGLWRISADNFQIPKTEIRATLYLESYRGSRSRLNATVELMNGNQVLQTITAPLTPDGIITMTPTVFGRFDVRISVPRFLSKKFTAQQIKDGTTINLSAVLTNGDADVDNAVTQADVTLITQNIGARTFGPLDLNGDGVVSQADANIASRNRGKVGQ